MNEINKIPKPQKSNLWVEVKKVGGSAMIVIPRDIANLMGVNDGIRLEMDVNDKKYGKRISLWNYKQQMKEYKRKVEELER